MQDTAIEMAKRLLIDSIWKSANLEGLGTTFPKTEAILANAPTTTKTEEFKTLQIAFYESAEDMDIISFMKTNCIKRVRR